MYSPFLDREGEPLTIEKVEFIHLEQLKECDEGYHLEYKRLLEDGGKAQLAKEIASFANCEGGWLIVGIEDKTKEINAIDKVDYSQKIGKIATRISPMPEFETKFITLPDNKSKGVLLIYVYEGKNAPYICNGSVYVRSGSSKEPIAFANRGNIEYLSERSRLYQKELNEFFKRDYFFPYNDLIHRTITYPIANIYLKNISSKKDDRLYIYKNRDKLIEFIMKEAVPFECIQYSMNSIIFMHKSILPSTNNGTFIFELFYDWSCKIYLPLGNFDFDEIKYAKERFKSMGIESSIVDNFKLINGGTVFNCIYYSIKLFENIANKYTLKEKDYAVCCEIENAAENIMIFSTENYWQYVNRNKIPYAQKYVNRSEIMFLKDYPESKFGDLAFHITIDCIGATFGIRSNDILEIWNEDNKKYIND